MRGFLLGPLTRRSQLVGVRWSSEMVEEEKPVAAEPELEYAFNHIERKKGLLKPIHSIEEQIAYMNSTVFKNTYKGLPVYKWYRRNLKVQPILAPPPRMFCIDKNGRFNVNHACPVCRDEYLFFDYRNPALIKQFLSSGTDQPIDLHKSGLCRDQYLLLRAQLLKAREHGTIEFGVEFRHFDYSQWYEDWIPTTAEYEEEPVGRTSTSFENLYPSEPVSFPPHIRDTNTNWDQWWLRHDKFARKAR